MAKETAKARELRKRRRRNPAGVWLARVREGKGYTLDEWAAALDYNKSTASRLETHGPVPVSVILAALAVPPNPKVANLTPEARRALEHTRRSQASRKAAATVRAERAKRSRAAKKAARARAKTGPTKVPAGYVKSRRELSSLTVGPKKKPARARRPAGPIGEPLGGFVSPVPGAVRRSDLPPGAVVAEEIEAAGGAGTSL